MSTTTERPELGRRAPAHPRARARIGAVLAAMACVLALAAPATAQARPATAAGGPLGPNVLVFDPGMPVEQIQAAVDGVAAEQRDAEMGSGRYALLFEPGTYGTAEHPLNVEVGYYTEVAGLGASPSDVTIHGHVDVYNRCFPDGSCTALDNFWRSVSNLTIDVAGGPDGCRQSADFWAVSQAAPMRRVDVRNGNLTLFDYCTAGPQYASGGFIADSRAGVVINGSQQQFLVRDSSLGVWTNGVWNQVFSGVEGAPAQSFGQPDQQPYTTLEKTPVSREKPFLTKGEHGWSVFVPAARTDSRGTTWADGATAGRSIPLSDFYVAHPGDSVQRINAELARGKNLLLTPGVYDVDRSIAVKRPDTVVLGLGLATLTAVHGAVPLTVADVKGVDVAGLTIDAGTVNSPALLRVGTQHAAKGKARAHNGWSDPADPTALQDVFFRIGGPHVGKATVALAVNSDHVVLDDIWAWRADHGVPGSVGWTVNTSDTGVVVNGDDVTATGLFSEHFQKYNVIWNGERGKTIFFQNELPYDAPDQAAWQHDGMPGYAAYKVSDSVRTHELWGGGSYIYTNVNPSLHVAHGFEVPVTPGVVLHDVLTVSLNKAGTIDHVVNDTGGAVTPDHLGPEIVVTYPAS
ncbi:MAG: adenylyl cyclase [Motilibacteraceae bacterium]